MIQNLEEMIAFERKRLLTLASRLLPYLTPEDILQPHDFPQLELNPEFRYQEGICVGLETALAALLAMQKT